eukprot:4261130-Pleurochrysis_carterae.AAC.1
MRRATPRLPRQRRSREMAKYVRSSCTCRSQWYMSTKAGGSGRARRARRKPQTSLRGPCVKASSSSGGGFCEA